MWPASIAVVAAYIPGNIKRVLKHPMLVGVKTLGGRASVRQWRPRRHYSVWCGAGVGGLRPHHASSAAPIPGRCRFPMGGRRNDIIAIVVGTILYAGARLGVPSACHRRAGFRYAGASDIDVVLCMSVHEQTPSADRARHSRPQGRRADRLPDLLSRAHRAHPRRLLRRHSGRRFARHGDARARNHRAGHARHDDPARATR